MSADENVVGKVSIKVWPDLDPFDRGLRLAVEKAEKKYRVHIPIEGDEAGLLRETRAAKQRVEREVGAVELEIDLDTSRLNRAIAKVKKKLSTLDEGAHVEVDFDRRGFDQLEDRLGELDESAKMKVEAVADDDSVIASRERINSLLRNRMNVAIQSEVDVDSVQASLLRLRHMLHSSDETVPVEVKPTVDNAMLQNTLRRINTAMKDIDAAEVDVEARDSTVRRLREGVEHALRGVDVEAELSDLSALGVRRRIERALSDVDVEVDAELSGADALVQRLRQKLSDRGFKIDMDLDKESERHTRKQIEDVIDDFDGDNVTLDVRADSLLARAELARVSRTRRVDLLVMVNKVALAKAQATLAAFAGLRLIDSTWSNVVDMFKNMDKNIPLIGAVSLAVQGLVGWLMAASSNVFSLVHGLGQISGLFLLLPGIMGGFATGIGATVAVLRDFNDRLPEIKDALGELRSVMSDQFWTIAASPIRDAFFGLLPEFEAGIKGTTTALGIWFSELADTLKYHLDGSMGAMFDGLNGSVLIAADGLDAFSESLSILGRKGAEYLPRLANWFRDMNERLREWLVASEESGRLNEIIEAGIENFVDLGNVVFHASGIIAGLGRAAKEAGGSTLGTLADKLERIHDVVDGERFQKNFTAALWSAHDAMDRISTQSGPRVTEFFENFTSMMVASMPAVGDSIGKLIGGFAESLSTDQFTRGVIDFFDGLESAIDSMNDLWTPLGDGLGSTLSLLGTFAESFGPILSTMLETIANIADRVGPSIETMVEALSGRLLTAMEITAPLVEVLVEALVRLVTPLTQVPGLIEGIVVAFATVKFARFAGRFATLAGILKNKLVIGLLGVASQGSLAAAAVGSLGDAAAYADPQVRNAAVAGKRLRRVLGGAGVVTLLVAAEQAFHGWVSNLGVVVPSVHDMAEAVSDLGDATARVELDKMFGGEDSKWSRRLGKAPGLYGAIAGAISKTSEVMGHGAINTGRMASEVDGLSDATALVDERLKAGFWDKLLPSGRVSDGLFRTSAAFKQAEGSLDAFDEAAGNLVRNGSPEEIARLSAEISREVIETGRSLHETGELYPEYAAAMREAEKEARTQAAAQAKVDEALKGVEKRTQNLTGLTTDSIEWIQESSKGFFSVSDAVGEADGSYKTFIQTLKDQVKAQAEWADNVTELTRRGVEEGVLQEMSKMGPEGRVLVADLVNASDEEISELNDVFTRGTAGAAAAAGTGFAATAEAALEEIRKLPPEARAEMDELVQSLEQAAIDGKDGLVSGFQTTEVAEALSGLGADAEAAYKDYMEIYSPSKLMQRHGKSTVDGLVAGIDEGKGPLETAADGLSEIVSGVWEGAKSLLNPAGKETVDGLQSGISSKFGALDTTAEKVKSTAVDVWDRAVTFLSSPGKSLMDGLRGGMDSRRSKVETGSTLAKDGIERVFNGARSFLSGDGRDLFIGLRSGMDDRRGHVETGASRARDGVKSEFSGAGSLLTPKGKSLFNGLRSGMRARLSAIGRMASSGLRAAMGKFSSLGGRLVYAGKALLSGFVAGIRSKIGTIRTVLQGLTSSLPSWKGPAAVDRVLLFKPGQLIIDGLVEGMESRFKMVRRSLGGLTSEIGDTDMQVPDVPTAGRSRWGLDDLGGGGGSTVINVHADVKDLGDLEHFREFAEMAEVWRAQGVRV